MTRLLGEAVPGPELSDALDRYRVSSFTHGAQTILACWAVEKDVDWLIPESFGEVVACFDLMGSPIEPPCASGRVLCFAERPIYLVFKSRK